MWRTSYSEPLERRTLLSAGDFDSTFGKGGVLTQSFGGDVQQPQIAVLADNKIVAAMLVTPTRTNDPELVVARFLQTGKLDPTFGKHGKIVISIAGGFQPYLSRLLIDSTGRILGIFNGDVFRMTPAGKLDINFGSGGWVRNLGAGDLALSPAGKIVATCGNNVDRLLANGSLDKSFGVKGTIAVGKADLLFGEEPFQVYDPNVTADGSIFVLISAGDFPDAIASGVCRITARGQIDTNFGEDGKLIVTAFQEDGLALDLALTKDGNIAVLSTCDDGGTIVDEFDAHGKAIGAFSDDGRSDGVVIAFDATDRNDSLIEDSDGKLVSTGMSRDAFIVARLNSDGSYDSTFHGGETIPNLAPGSEGFQAAVGPNHNIVLATTDDDGLAPPHAAVSLRLIMLQGRSTASTSQTVSISANGALTINGTSRNDDIQVTETSDTNPADTFMTASVNGNEFTFYEPGITSIQIDADAGDDSVTTSINAADVTLAGGDGNDHLDAGFLSGEIDGGSGKDTLISEFGAATLFGGSGNDLLLPAGTDEILIGGPGNDTADFSAFASNLKITLDNLPNDGPAGAKMNVESDIENVIGGSGNDLIIGNPSFNHLYGGPGNDTLYGGGGNDTLEGGHGHDQLFGQDGNDLLVARDSRYDLLDGGDGFDTASADDSASAKDQMMNVESLID